MLTSFALALGLFMSCTDIMCHQDNILIIGDSEAGAAATQLQRVKQPYEHVDLDYKVGSQIQFWTSGAFKKSLDSHPGVDEVIIFLGTNNYGSKSLPDVTPILDEIKRRNLKCVWVGPTAVFGKKWPINDLLKASVSSTCTYVDTQALGVELHDGVHPTPAGALKWLRFVWSVK